MEESVKFDLLQGIKDAFHLDDLDPNQVPPLVLAYIGDGFYELLIRTKIIHSKKSQVNALHQASAALVKASAQAKMLERFKEDLTDEEFRIYKRGRNANSHSAAKNSTIQDYRMATGVEALMGYLYLKGDFKRAMDLVNMGLEKREDE